MKGKRLHLFVGALLFLHTLFALSSAVQNSVTYDEVAHLTAGYSHLGFGDFRLVTEHPPLVFLWCALPLLIAKPAFPSFAQAAWEKSDAWNIGWKFFYESRNDHEKMLLQGRLMALIFSLGLGILVYLWSKKLFGHRGGLLSLALYSFSPTILAHGNLVANDMAVAFFFIAVLWGLWNLLHEFSLKVAILTTLAMAGLFLSKFSAVLIIPIGFLLLLIRIVSKKPLKTGKSGMEITSVPKQLGIFIAFIVFQIIIVAAAFWAGYGFRYSPFTKGDLSRARFEIRYELKEGETPWDYLLKDSTAVSRMTGWLRERKILPEAYLYGFLYALKTTEERSAFLNGEIRTRGWWYFFPYTFLVKTPLPLFGLMFFAALASLFPQFFKKTNMAEKSAPFRERLYQTAPLWCFFAIYWITSITSHLNIGHRHILPVYPVIFILSGAAAAVWNAERIWMRWATRAMVILFLLCSLSIQPHYLSYFNSLVGGPKNGYKHLVDSSLDWGQNLKTLKKLLEEGNPKIRTDMIYLSYFGMGNPDIYHIGARMLPCIPPKSGAPFFPLTQGLYCISATNLQQQYLLPSCRWTESMEKAYQEANQIIAEYKKEGGGSKVQNPLVLKLGEIFWNQFMEFYNKLRFARLCALLRRKNPDAFAGYSILLYQVTDEEAERAENGPPLELVPDTPLMKSDRRFHIHSPLAEMHFVLGNKAVDLGKEMEALKEYQKSLEYEPDFPEAKHNLELLLQNMGKEKKAPPSIKRD